MDQRDRGASKGPLFWPLPASIQPFVFRQTIYLALLVLGQKYDQKLVLVDLSVDDACEFFEHIF